MKENNGRGARRKLIRRLTFIIAPFVVLFGFLTLIGFGRFRRQQLRSAVQGEKYGHAGLGGGGGGGGLGASTSWKQKLQKQFVRAKESDVLEQILSAQLHLVDLHIEQAEVARSPSDSYEGVYGSFCQVDFSLHKKDPSRGT